MKPEQVNKGKWYVVCEHPDCLTAQEIEEGMGFEVQQAHTKTTGHDVTDGWPINDSKRRIFGLGPISRMSGELLLKSPELNSLALGLLKVSE